MPSTHHAGSPMGGSGRAALPAENAQATRGFGPNGHPQTGTAGHSVTLSHVGLSWPDGQVVFEDVNATFDGGRTGLVGPNGTGKSALLRLVAGELRPTRGNVATSSTPAYLGQRLTLDLRRTVAELMGIGEIRRALAAVLAGHEERLQENLDAVGEDWDIEERSIALLAAYGLPADSVRFLDRQVRTLSGGEAMIAALAGRERARRPITLLDEPTNNLDRVARHRLYAAVERWPGTLIMASHDAALLRLVDGIVELRPVRVRSGVPQRVDLVRHGGNWDAYVAGTQAELALAQRRVRDAGARLGVEKRQRIEAETKVARRARQGLKAAEGMPRILANAARSRAQESAGKTRGTMAGREQAAAGDLAAARDALPEVAAIQIDLPATRVPAGRTVVELPAASVRPGVPYDAGSEVSAEGRMVLRGPERVGLTGPNGIGKTTLLGRLSSESLVPVGYLRQRDVVDGATGGAGRRGIRGGGDEWAGLDDVASVLENVRRAAPGAPPGVVRDRLARFHFRGGRVEQLVSELSGGERFRVALACILLADPAPQLLLLDEPTNNLDVASVGQLVSALESYEGALVVSSHDAEFLSMLAPLRSWELRRGTG